MITQFLANKGNKILVMDMSQKNINLCLLSARNNYNSKKETMTFIIPGIHPAHLQPQRHEVEFFH